MFSNPSQTLGFATKFIRAGEEITDTYCPTYAAIGPTERGQSLAKYNFACNCTPCAEEWPTLDQLPRKFHGLPTQCYRIDSKEKVFSFLKPKFSWKVTSLWHRLHVLFDRLFCHSTFLSAALEVILRVAEPEKRWFNNKPTFFSWSPTRKKIRVCRTTFLPPSKSLLRVQIKKLHV